MSRASRRGDMKVKLTKFLSSADLLHDFDPFLCNNSLYIKYRDKYIKPHMNCLGKDMNYYLNSEFENLILHGLAVYFKHTNPTLSHPTTMNIFTMVPFKHFTIEFSKFVESSMGTPFILNLNDGKGPRITFENPDLQRVIVGICATKAQNNVIKFIKDTCSIPDEYFCKFEFQDIKSKLITTEVSCYDLAYSKPKGVGCHNEESIGPQLELRKTDGNIFSLEKFIIGNSTEHPNITDGTISFVPSSTSEDHREVQIPLKDYMLSHRTQHSRRSQRIQQLDAKYKTLFQNAINELNQSGGNPETALQKIERVYNIGINTLQDTDTLLHFIGMLFDLKRAGDQMLVEAAHKLNAIFISQDKLAVAYAYFRGIPCILTNVDKNIMIFYNFDSKAILSSIDSIDTTGPKTSKKSKSKKSKTVKVEAIKDEAEDEAMLDDAGKDVRGGFDGTNNDIQHRIQCISMLQECKNKLLSKLDIKLGTSDTSDNSSALHNGMELLDIIMVWQVKMAKLDEKRDDESTYENAIRRLSEFLQTYENDFNTFIDSILNEKKIAHMHATPPAAGGRLRKNK